MSAAVETGSGSATNCSSFSTPSSTTSANPTTATPRDLRHRQLVLVAVLCPQLHRMGMVAEGHPQSGLDVAAGRVLLGQLGEVSGPGMVAITELSPDSRRLGDDQPVAVSVGRGSDADNGLVEGEVAGGPVKLGVAEGEDATVGMGTPDPSGPRDHPARRGLDTPDAPAHRPLYPLYAIDVRGHGRSTVGSAGLGRVAAVGSAARHRDSTFRALGAANAPLSIAGAAVNGDPVWHRPDRPRRPLGLGGNVHTVAGAGRLSVPDLNVRTMGCVAMRRVTGAARNATRGGDGRQRSHGDRSLRWS